MRLIHRCILSVFLQNLIKKSGNSPWIQISGAANLKNPKLNFFNFWFYVLHKVVTRLCYWVRKNLPITYRFWKFDELIEFYEELSFSRSKWQFCSKKVTLWSCDALFQIKSSTCDLTIVFVQKFHSSRHLAAKIEIFKNFSRHNDRKWSNSSNSCMKLLSDRLWSHLGRKWNSYGILRIKGILLILNAHLYDKVIGECVQRSSFTLTDDLEKISMSTF